MLQSRRPILNKCFDHDVRHRLGVPADLIDLFIGQSDGFVAKQLATAIDRDLVCVEKRRVDLFHRRPHSRVELFGVRALSASADLTDALVRGADAGLSPTSTARGAYLARRWSRFSDRETTNVNCHQVDRDAVSRSVDGCGQTPVPETMRR